MPKKPPITYSGNDAEWNGRKCGGSIYGEGTAQPVDDWDNHERGTQSMSIKLTKRGTKIEPAGPRRLAIPKAGMQDGMRTEAQSGRPGWPPDAPAVPGPQSWAEEDQ